MVDYACAHTHAHTHAFERIMEKNKPPRAPVRLRIMRPHVGGGSRVPGYVYILPL